MLGKRALIVFKTTHIDRAGETGAQVLKYGEIVALEDQDWLVIAAEEGVRLRCPAAKLHRAPAKSRFLGPRGRPVEPDYIAAEELIRDFHSARRPLVVRWLGRRASLALCKAAGL